MGSLNIFLHDERGRYIQAPRHLPRPGMDHSGSCLFLAPYSPSCLPPHTHAPLRLVLPTLLPITRFFFLHPMHCVTVERPLRDARAEKSTRAPRRGRVQQ